MALIIKIIKETVLIATVCFPTSLASSGKANHLWSLNIKPKKSLIIGNHLRASTETEAINMIENQWNDDYEYFIDELYNAFLDY